MSFKKNKENLEDKLSKFNENYTFQDIVRYDTLSQDYSYFSTMFFGLSLLETTHIALSNSSDPWNFVESLAYLGLGWIFTYVSKKYKRKSDMAKNYVKNEFSEIYDKLISLQTTKLDNYTLDENTAKKFFVQ